MTHVLVIETAAPSSVVALGNENGVLFDDAPVGRMEGPVYLRRAVREGLAGNGLTTADIDVIAVDLGPGGLTATRSGVTFANALAYGLGKPLVALSYFDLVGLQTFAETGRVAACVRPTTEGDAFLALYGDSGLGELRFGNLERLIAMARDETAAPLPSGLTTPAVAALLGDDPTGVAVPSPAVLVARALELHAAGAGVDEPLEPLTNVSPGVTPINEGYDHG
ncbi:MAG: tRNA (adenosine(37)-N6)-threonylcarbamoyltransferase complex dimerization subunit type 1 TsaB [Rhodospirillales bacterium]|nr:tRNA (adenosine(37)-N6)-threonylcarbamoyltransferase complex dimerization subunit type 1 TsaB [Rhodospirillales bacterium]